MNHLTHQPSGFSSLLPTPVSVPTLLFPFGIIIQLLDFLVMAGFLDPQAWERRLWILLSFRSS